MWDQLKIYYKHCGHCNELTCHPVQHCASLMCFSLLPGPQQSSVFNTPSRHFIWPSQFQRLTGAKRLITYETDVPLTSFLHERLESESAKRTRRPVSQRSEVNWSEWLSGNTDEHQRLQQPLVGVTETIGKHLELATQLSTQSKKHLRCSQSWL